MALPDKFEKYVMFINEYLDHLIPADQAPPEPIHRAMRYSLFAGGKRLRPILTLAVTESLRANPEVALPLAAAIEMVHTYSLIHDDLPSMDNDDFRRGKPTNHRVFGEAIAILAGDALLTSAMELLANAPYEPAVRCRLAAMLSSAAGTRGMIGGQVMDISSETKILDRVDLEKLHGMKTAALIGFAAVGPAVMLQSGEEAERALSQYGQLIGLAFQIVDDILDVEGKTEILGKTAGKDQSLHRATYPSLLGLDESKRLALDLVDTAILSIGRYDPYSYLEQLAGHILQREK